MKAIFKLKTFIILSLLFQVYSNFEIILHGPKNVRPKKMDVSSFCRKIPKEISSNLRYVFTNNNCVLLWEDEDCLRKSFPIVTKESKNMPALNFEDMFSSISDCSKSQSHLEKSSKKFKSNNFLNIFI